LVTQVLVSELAPGSFFVHAGDENTTGPRPERAFRIIGQRSRTAIVENGLGVRQSMSAKTPVLPLDAAVWTRVAVPKRPPATEERKAVS
jgi:hypothetical protein